MSAYGERIARVEIEVQELKREFHEFKRETSNNFDDVHKKLDALLALRNKGAGVFWLISATLGSGMLAAIYELFKNWK